MISQVKVLRTLKAGDNIWHDGEIVGPPVPGDLLSEIQRGWVVVLKEEKPKPTIIRVASGVESTSISNSMSSNASFTKTKPLVKKEPIGNKRIRF